VAKVGLYPQSEKMVQMLKSRGVPHEFYTAHGKGHAFTNWHWQDEAQKAYSAIADWLDKDRNFR
jgi:dipeptidyl aminopeptidase/acylaminoacyl peptidase